MAGFSILQEAAIPFNGSGSFSLAEPPFVALTTISSAAMNSDLADIADGLSNCLTTDGQSSMSAQLKAFAGSVVSPGITFSTDLNTGFYRIAADNIGVSCGGTKILDISSSGLDVTGSIKQNGIVLLPVGLGPLPWAGSSAPSGWLLCYGQSLLRSSYADLFAAIGTTYGAADGSHFSLPDLRGRAPAGRDDMGGVAASRLTSATMTPDGITLGAVGGDQTHTLTKAEAPSGLITLNDPGHTHLVGQNSGAASSGASIATTANYIVSTTQVVTNSVTTGVTLTDNGEDAAHINVQPTIITNYIIYAGV